MDEYKTDYLISTHAPLAGRDAYSLTHSTPPYRFQPTRPLRGATALKRGAQRPGGISTHAPLAGRDSYHLHNWDPADDISTHAPLAGRDRVVLAHGTGSSVFQPTRPLRGATTDIHDGRRKTPISTHAPLAGRDKHGPFSGFRRRGDFNPRAPCGARRQSGGGLNPRRRISTHAPLAGRDSFFPFRAKAT